MSNTLIALHLFDELAKDKSDGHRSLEIQAREVLLVRDAEFCS
jgi:hypothetical protein